MLPSRTCITCRSACRSSPIISVASRSFCSCAVNSSATASLCAANADFIAWCASRSVSSSPIARSRWCSSAVALSRSAVIISRSEFTVSSISSAEMVPGSPSPGHHPREPPTSVRTRLRSRASPPRGPRPVDRARVGSVSAHPRSASASCFAEFSLYPPETEPLGLSSRRSATRLRGRLCTAWRDALVPRDVSEPSRPPWWI